MFTPPPPLPPPTPPPTPHYISINHFSASMSLIQWYTVSLNPHINPPNSATPVQQGHPGLPGPQPSLSKLGQSAIVTSRGRPARGPQDQPGPQQQQQQRLHEDPRPRVCWVRAHGATCLSFFHHHRRSFCYRLILVIFFCHHNFFVTHLTFFPHYCHSFCYLFDIFSLSSSFFFIPVWSFLFFVIVILFVTCLTFFCHCHHSFCYLLVLFFTSLSFFLLLVCPVFSVVVLFVFMVRDLILGWFGLVSVSSGTLHGGFWRTRVIRFGFLFQRKIKKRKKVAVLRQQKGEM